MNGLQSGDTVRLRWPYTDLQGGKTRPALVMSGTRALPCPAQWTILEP